MRAVGLLLTAATLASSGCSWLVVNAGEDLGKLTTRSHVHDTFGPPTAAGQSDGSHYEEFTTHRKIAEPWKTMFLAMNTVGTFGLGEFVWFPHQLYVAGRRSLVGQRLRFTYDDAGSVTGASLDGESIPWARGPSRVPDEPPERATGR